MRSTDMKISGGWRGVNGLCRLQPTGPVDCQARTGHHIVAVGQTLAGSAERALDRKLKALQQRVVVDADHTTAGSPASALARRNLGALQPGVRQRITDQVRANSAQA